MLKVENPCVRAAVIAALAVASPALAAADGAPPPAPLQDGMLGELAAASTFATVAATQTTTKTVTALGVNARAGGSLRYFLTGMKHPGPGLRVNDSWAFEFSTGYASVPEDSSLWFEFRLEATLRAVYVVSSDLDLFARGGYLTGTNNARGKFSTLAGGGGSTFDALFVTAGARSGRVRGEVGYGVAATSQDNASYLLATASYRFRERGLFQHLGVRFENFPAVHEVPSSMNLRLVFGSN